MLLEIEKNRAKDTSLWSHLYYSFEGRSAGQIVIPNATGQLVQPMPGGGNLPDGRNIFNVLKGEGFIVFDAGTAFDAKAKYAINPEQIEDIRIPNLPHKGGKAQLWIDFFNKKSLKVDIYPADAQKIYDQVMELQRAAIANGGKWPKPGQQQEQQTPTQPQEQQQPQAKHEGDGWSAGVSSRSKPSPREKITPRSEQAPGSGKLARQ